MLQAEGLAAFRGERLVLRDLSFEVADGGALLLKGPNGSGKSTLLRLIAGLVRAAAGRLLWNGEDALADFAGQALRTAYLGHQDAVKPGLTVAENLRFAARVGGGCRLGGSGPHGPCIACRIARPDAVGRAEAAASAGAGRALPCPAVAAGRADARPRRCLDRPARIAARGASRAWRHRRGGDASAIAAIPRDRTAPGMTPFTALLARELRLALRHAGDTLAAVLFFVLAASLFPLAVGPAPETLGRLAPGIIWVCALLAALLPLDRLFGADHEDGSLDQLLLCGLPAAAVAAAKALAHWLVTGLPLLLAAAPLGVMLRMPGEALPALLAGLLPGTLVLSLLGTTGAAVVLGARRGGVLLPLLVLPLATPVLVFGVSAADAAAAGLSVRPHLLLLTALLAAGLPLCPLASGAALRHAAE